MIQAIYSAIIQEKLLVDQQQALGLFHVKHRTNKLLKSTLIPVNHANEVKIAAMGTTNSTNRTKIVEIFD